MGHGGVAAAAGSGDVPAPLVPLRLVNRVVDGVEGVVLVLALLAMVGLSFTQVLLRVLQPYNPAFQPIPWIGPFTQYLVVWVGLIGASIATREGRHFGVEALTKSFGVTGRRRLDLVLSIVSGTFTAFLAILSWNHLLLSEMKPGMPPVFEVETLHLRVMRWQLLSIVPVELTIMCGRFLIRVLEALLLEDDDWNEHDKSLRPELEGPPPVVPPLEPPAPAPAPAAPAERSPPQDPAPPAEGSPPVEPPAALPSPSAAAAKRPEKATDEVRTYRIADTGDVVEPEPRPGDPAKVDEDAQLVDSEAAESDEIEAAEAATERVPLRGAPPPAQPPRPEGGTP